MDHKKYLGPCLRKKYLEKAVQYIIKHHSFTFCGEGDIPADSDY